MTRHGLAALALALGTIGVLACGKYGPPVRAGASATTGASAGAVSTHDAAACSDPAHDHDAGDTPAP